jgi:hypothetical protein
VCITLWVLVVGLITMYLVVFSAAALERLARPLDELIYGESWLLDGARRVARGEGLYGPPTQLPLMHYAYTPLYYAIVGGLIRIFGDSGYTLGRLVSIVSTLGGALALAWTVRRITSRWSYGALAAGLFLTQNLTALLWGSLSRVDALGVGLSLLGLAVFVSGRTSLSAIVFLLALLTKQTFFIEPLVAGLALWPWRARFVRFAAILVGGGLISVGVATWLTGGWFLWHTILANSNELDLPTFAVLMGTFLQYNGLVVVAACVACVLPCVNGEGVWRLYFAGCLVTLPTVAKLGASSNYWLELSAVTSVLLAIASCKLAGWPGIRLVPPTILAGALLIAVPAYQATAMDAADSLAALAEPPETSYLSLIGDGAHYAPPLRVDVGLANALAREPGDLLTDNSGLSVAADKPIMYEFQIFQLLEAEKRWTEEPIVEAINARRFAVVALMHPLDGPTQDTRWTPGIVAALQQAYEPAGAQDGFWLYRPRS